MKSILFGNGYWGRKVKDKIAGLTELTQVVDSKSKYNLDDIDIAFICCSTDSHYEVIHRCIEKEIKYLFCTKPFTGHYDKARELFKIAKQRGVNIFVDNLFLFRKEIININIKDAKHIFFHWQQPELRENIFDSLFYHDLYLLSKWSKSDEWKAKYVYDDGSWCLKMENGLQTCHFRYTTRKESKKWIAVDNYTIDLSYPENDPLQECIVNMLNDKIDYNMSKKITLNTLKLMNTIHTQL